MKKEELKKLAKHGCPYELDFIKESEDGLCAKYTDCVECWAFCLKEYVNIEVE